MTSRRGDELEQHYSKTLNVLSRQKDVLRQIFDILAGEIIENLEAGLESFREIIISINEKASCPEIKLQ